MSSSSLGLRSALAFATVAHVLAALSLGAVPLKAARPATSEVQREIALDVEADTHEGTLAPTEHASEARTRSVASSGNASAPSSIAGARARAARESASSEPGTTPGEVPPTDSSWSFDPTRGTPVDLGIGSHWKTVVAEGAAESQPGARSAALAEGEDIKDRARAIDRSMREMLTARDVSLGLGRAGPLVSATRDAASSSSAPDVGATILEIESNSSGTVVAAHAEDSAWNEVARAVVRRMAGKALRVAPGSRGLRARLRVVAERALPSGARGSSSVGAVPDDVPGGNKVCDGEGIHRRCVAGMPAGATNASHDLSNVGAKPTRIVHVQLLAESEL